MKRFVVFWVCLTAPILAQFSPPFISTLDNSIISLDAFSIFNSTENKLGHFETPLGYLDESTDKDTPTYVGPYAPSHTTGLISDLQNVFVGPGTGASPSPANTWTINVQSNPAGADTKFIVLHFTEVSLPGNNRLEVELNYDPQETDVFRSSDIPASGDLWTRPINIKPLAGAPIVVRYITSGTTTGKVRLAQIGVGQPVGGRFGSRSNSDPFLLSDPFVEPTYDPFWFCTQPPTWENSACVTDPADLRAKVARSVGMFVGPTNSNTQLSTCSCTLVDTDKVILAGHCIESREEALAHSVIFDYQTNCDLSRPAGYNPRFYKVKRVIDWVSDIAHTGVDYLYLEIVPPPGVPPLQLRPDLPDLSENVFGVHHPNGSPKKLSIPYPNFVKPSTVNEDTIMVPKPFHVSGGSSGSALFDTAGRVLGVLSNGDPCGRIDPAAPFDLKYYPSSSILKKISTPLGPSDPPISRDVMIVFDRSGSMSELDSTKRTKIEVARDAVSLFVQLVRKNAGNHVGLVSFSTAASSPVDFPLQGVDDNTKAALIGPKPFSGGKVGLLIPGGSTSIGDGLKLAGQQLSPGGTNARSILLMTDGMQNTAPLIDNAQVQNAIDGIPVNIIGFGKPSNLDGVLLNKLANKQGGLYSNAVSEVALQKFFTQTYGNLFEAGILKDPEYDIPADQEASESLGFQVCGEESITVAVGWDNADASLRVNLTTPAGNSITGASDGVEEAIGRAWTFLRVPLPYNDERSGTWNVTVFRPREQIPVVTRQQSQPPLHYFLNIIPTGGPRLLRIGEAKSYFTGDTINPLVNFRFNDGTWPEATIELTLSRPNASLGGIISNTDLKAPVQVGGDVIPSKQATLNVSGIEISQIEETFLLSSEPENAGGGFEETGIYGTVLKENFTTEGEYTFHVRAKTEGSCVYNRELLWSIHVDVGIDPTHTPTTTVFTGTGSDGKSDGTITIKPGDKYGNPIGPGRSSDIPVTGSTGTVITGPIKDNGDGTYTIPISWDPSTGSPPGVVITQPGRNPIVVTQPGVCTPPVTNPGGGTGKCEKCISDPGKNKCHATTSCSSTPFGTMCICRPGYRADAKGDASSVHWRLKWPVAGHEHRVYVAPGQVCDTLCDKWYLGAESCQEVAITSC